MKIALFASSCVPIHAKTLEERPLGGTETGVIRLAEALQALGHEITVFTTHPHPPAHPGTPRYLPLPAIETHPAVDVLISIRDWVPLLYKIQAKKRMLWTGDSYDAFSNFGIGDKRITEKMDCLLTVSEWHKNSLCAASGFPPEKSFVIGNGIEPSYFEGTEIKQRKRMVYSSTPHRGLAYAAGLFRKLKERHADAELHVFSSYQVYAPARAEERPPYFDELEKTPGIFMHGSLKQSELARELMKSSLLFYPCDFEETCCITALEAQAASCAIVSSQLAALPETVGESGILVPGRASDSNYGRAFVDACDKLLSNDELWNQKTQWGKEHVRSFTWIKVAERFSQFLKKSL